MGERWDANSPIPRAKAGVAEVELDGERVLYDAQRWGVLRLDPVASLVWSVLDGTGTVAELAADVADAFSVPSDEALGGIIDLLADLSENGFLESTDPEPADADTSHLVDPPDT